MHLIIALFFILAVWRWGDWRNWQTYNASMLFTIMGNFLYNFLYADQLLWQMKSSFSLSYKMVELIYSFTILPLTTLLFLTNFPKEFNKQFFRILTYIAIYTCLELAMIQFGVIQYYRGWNFWYSVAWDSMMFTVIALHFKKPLISYLVSLVVFLTMITHFPVF